jgi:ABC-type transporter Mla subunit MlaD
MGSTLIDIPSRPAILFLPITAYQAGGGTNGLKKIFDQVKDAAEDLKEKAEAKIKEVRDTLDKDHDNIPDALEGLAEKAKTLASQAQDKAKVFAEQAEMKASELAGQAEVKYKEAAGMAQEKFDQATAKVGEMADQTKVKLDEVKGEAEKAVYSARERMGMSDKDGKKD